MGFLFPLSQGKGRVMRGNCEDCTFTNSFGDTFLTNHYTRKRFLATGKMYKEQESYGIRDVSFGSKVDPWRSSEDVAVMTSDMLTVQLQQLYCFLQGWTSYYIDSANRKIPQIPHSYDFTFCYGQEITRHIYFSIAHTI